uniref:Pseudouridine synthase RsuA/RluA-like domain-containing protein n=1 Tax=Chenopodium quinoa TaxID=63459 RepID=A0A803MEQ9_CHEQI
MTTAIGIQWPEFNDGLTYNDVISPSSSGLTLINFYSSNYSSSAPLQGWLQRIHNGQITIDGDIVTDPDTVLRVGSKLVYHRLPWSEPETPFLLEVLYEDDDMIAINKPSGLQVLPGGLFQQRTVLTQLKWHANKNGNSSPGQLHPVPVHRLGRGTSGVLLCAKTKSAKARLAAYFADGTSLSLHPGQNALFGIAYGFTAFNNSVVVDKVLINKPIGIIRYPGVAKGLYVALPSGKPALSKVRVLERDLEKDQSLVQVEIQSGRPHQIRIHLSLIGYPLLDDPLYVAGGQPECFDSELVEEDFAEDG